MLFGKKSRAEEWHTEFEDFRPRSSTDKDLCERGKVREKQRGKEICVASV